MGRKKKPSLKGIPEELIPYVDKNGNIDLTKAGDKGGDLLRKYVEDDDNIYIVDSKTKTIYPKSFTMKELREIMCFYDFWNMI